MLRLTQTLQRWAGAAPWTKEGLKRAHIKERDKATRTSLRLKYEAGLMRGDTIDDVSVDRRELKRQVDASGRHHMNRRQFLEGKGQGDLYNFNHSRQQTLLGNQAYQQRQLNRLARGDRQNEKIAKLREYHFPMLK